jgi:hypothetical protein
LADLIFRPSIRKITGGLGNAGIDTPAITLDAAVIDHHACAFGGEAQRLSAPNSATRTCDQRDKASQASHLR